MTFDPTAHLCAHLAYGGQCLDIAHQMVCMVCHSAQEDVDFIVPDKATCHECGGLGYWWITSAGHRLRPYWTLALDQISWETPELRFDITDIPPPPDDAEESWSAPATGTADAGLLALLGIGKADKPKMRR